jgi:hypothetical protein
MMHQKNVVLKVGSIAKLAPKATARDGIRFL